MKTGVARFRAGVAAVVLASLSTGLVAFGPVPAQPPAEAQAEALRVHVAYELPEDGQLDLRHNLKSIQDPSLVSLYALRNTAIEDLIRTRKVLKTLLGGSERARKLRNEPKLSFEIPKALKDLFLPSSTPSAQALQAEADWLAKNEPAFDVNLRARVLLALLYMSGNIARFDQQLKFLQKDFWEKSPIREEFGKAEILPMMNASAGQLDSASLSTIYELTKKEWLEKHGMTEVLATLAGHREFLLDQYHLLGIELSGRPLYQHLYESLQKLDHQFPNAQMAQAPIEFRLPKGNDPIPFATEFETAFNRAFDGFEKSKPYTFLASEELNGKLDQALLAALKANTEQLERLASETDYTGAWHSALLELVRYEGLWNTMTAKYGYLKNRVDFGLARKSLERKLEETEKKETTLRYASYAGALGLGVLGLVASVGSEAAVLGMSARVWFGASGAASMGQGLYDYVNSRLAAQVAKGLYLGTFEQGSHDAMKDSLLISDQNYRMVLVGLITMGSDLPIIEALSYGKRLVQSGGKVFVAVTSRQMKLIRGALDQVAPKAFVLGPLGRAALASIRRALGMVSDALPESVISLEKAIPALAQSLRMAPSVVRERLESYPVIGALMKGYADRIKADPEFLAKLVQLEVVGASVGLVSEIQARSDKFLDEVKYVAIDEATGSIGTAAMLWIQAPRFGQLAGAAAKSLPKTIFEPGYRWKDRWQTFYDRGKRNFIVAFANNAGTASVFDGIEYAKGDSGKTLGQIAKDNLEFGFFAASFVAVSGNARFQLFSYIQDKLKKRLGDDPRATVLINSLATTNSLFGGWHWVKLARLTGVQGDKDAVKSEPNLELIDGDAYLKFEDLHSTGASTDPLLLGLASP